MISSPHSPLFAAADANSASARSPNFRVAAASRGFLPLENVATVYFDCAGCVATKTSAGSIPQAKITATANPTRTVHLWQIMFRESIVETAKRLRLASRVEDAATKIRLESSAVAPRNLGT